MAVDVHVMVADGSVQCCFGVVHDGALSLEVLLDPHTLNREPHHTVEAEDPPSTRPIASVG